MNASPLISVIMPAYNASRTIADSIESILRQDYENIEVIVVDDGSVDDTLRIAEKISDKDSRVRLFHKKNGGVSSARNMALTKAIGEHVAFLDADDVYEEKRFGEQVAVLQQDDTVGLVFGRHRVKDNHTGATHDTHSLFPRNGDTKAMLLHLLQHGYFFNLNSSLVRRTAIRHPFNERLKTAEDFDFVLRLAMESKFVGIEQYVTVILRGHDSLTVTEKSNIYKNERKVVEKFLTENRRGLRPFLSAKSHQHLRFSKRYHKNSTRLSLYHGMASIAYNPLNDLAYKHLVMQLMLRRR